jgi:hypothetical protein
MNQKIEIASAVVAREIGGEMMLMDLDSGTYFGLNAIGGRIWRALENGEPIEDLCAQLAQEFDVRPDTLHKDVDELLARLQEQKLISVG